MRVTEWYVHSFESSVSVSYVVPKPATFHLWFYNSYSVRIFPFNDIRRRAELKKCVKNWRQVHLACQSFDLIQAKRTYTLNNKRDKIVFLIIYRWSVWVSSVIDKGCFVYFKTVLEILTEAIPLYNKKFVLCVIYRQYATVYQYSDTVYTIRSHYGYIFWPKTVIFRPMKNIIKVQWSSTQWDPISVTVKVKIMYDEIPIFIIKTIKLDGNLVN